MDRQQLPSYQAISQNDGETDVGRVEFAAVSENSRKTICFRSTAAIFLTIAIGLWYFSSISTSPKSSTPRDVALAPSSRPIICQYGGFCRKNSDCVPGNKCNIQSQYYSQCVPDPTQYSTNPSCVQEWGQCSSTSICCDPGAVCNSNHQCTQIQSPLCVNPNNYASYPSEDDRYDAPSFSPSQIPSSKNPSISPSNRPTTTPTKSQSFYNSTNNSTTTPQKITRSRLNFNESSSTLFPSLSPLLLTPSNSPVPLSSSPSPTGGATVFVAQPTVFVPQLPTNPNLICQNGGYCYRDSDCVAGNRCNILSAYYSQCVADPSQYRSDEGCLLNGGSPCNSTTICCDPGAFCNYNLSIPQCTSIDSPLCRFPNTYQSANPSESPTENPTFAPFKLNSTDIGFSGSNRPPTRQPTRKPSVKSPAGSSTGGKTAVPTRKPTLQKPTAEPTLTRTDVVYHGGHVQTGPFNLYHIFFGQISSNTQSLMNYFGTNVGGSNIYSVLGSYYGMTGNQKASISTQVTLVKSAQVQPGAHGSNVILTDSSIQQYIQNLIKAGTLPADENALYPFMFRGDVTFDGWLTSWCGYHSDFIANAPNGQTVTIKYSVIGDPTYGGSNSFACAILPSQTANNDMGADSMASVYMHELAESVTDWNADAWYFDGGCPWAGGGNEIGDACNFNFGVDTSVVNWNTYVGSKQFLLQRVWQPGGYECVLYRH